MALFLLVVMFVSTLAIGFMLGVFTGFWIMDSEKEPSEETP